MMARRTSTSTGLNDSVLPTPKPRSSLLSSSTAANQPRRSLPTSTSTPTLSTGIKPPSSSTRKTSLAYSSSPLARQNSASSLNRSIIRPSKPASSAASSASSRLVVPSTPTPTATASNSVAQHKQDGQEEEEEEDLVTQVPDQAELDDEMQAAIQSVIQAHSNQLTGLRRVLSNADHGSSMSIHLLHAEIKLLQDQISIDQLEMDRLKKLNYKLISQSSATDNHHHSPSDTNHANRPTIDVLSSSNDAAIRRHFRILSPPSRLHLLHILLEATIPGDISSLRRYLEKIERSKRDFIGHLPQDLAVRCLVYLDLPSILRVRLVSQRWNEVVTRSGLKLWRALSLSLTSKDDEPPKPQHNTTEGWFELYKGLHYREENWRKGLAQKVVVLKGHTGSIGAIKLRGNTLVTGSLDGTLRIWNVRTSHCLKIVKMPAPVSSLDFYGQYGPTGVIAAGGNDVGRVFLISMNGSILSTLSGHNKGIRTLAINSQYLVSGGYDKALVVWNWREGTRIVKFGQQTNPCAAISLFGSTFSSVQVDGVIRCFNILTRELLSQHKVQTSPERGTDKMGIGGDVFQWFVAEARRVIIATKTKIYQLEYKLQEGGGIGPDGSTPVDLASPPRLISLTPIKHELNSGTLDVLKRRFAAAPRFATRLGDDMRIFIGHLPEYSDKDLLSTHHQEDEADDDDDDDDSLQPIGGAWLDTDARVLQRNPTCMNLSSDQLVVGCSDGLLYALDFCGTAYRPSSS
ncbi:hypothetical protein Pst134EA_013364 [Puccinia striiformis f. sp. tritici]|uniref:hypothetical protein n=1 Tax=Puccinia striiformis f. sp. tritici TaxID=168172 RepID=UPI002007E0A4|nr:hypothetical protein Pst134EA_013364 [Puccinia striiformis f. sp. tritici]KAH9465483.1 hypothetical protein Pst134EA_013364 [Puccinia striiformis f. sp. tritici]